MMTIQPFTFGPLAENTYIVHDEKGEALIVDPGCSEAGEWAQVDEYILSNNLRLRLLLNTHCHVDHVQGNYHIKEKYKVPFRILAEEEHVLRAVKAYAASMGFFHYEEALPDSYFKEGEDIEVGSMRWKVLFLPGHSPGHVGFYCEKERALFSGDVLFQSSIGRTDLPGGDYATLIRSIQQKLFSLPPDVTVYAGHGDTTTIGVEQKTNPYCRLR